MSVRDTLLGILKTWQERHGAAADTPEGVLDAYDAELRVEHLREAADLAASRVKPEHPDCAACSMAAVLADELRLRAEAVAPEKPTGWPHTPEFRMSPDGDLIAFSQPPRTGWLLFPQAVKGRRIKADQMTRLTGWTRFLPTGKS